MQVSVLRRGEAKVFSVDALHLAKIAATASNHMKREDSMILVSRWRLRPWAGLAILILAAMATAQRTASPPSSAPPGNNAAAAQQAEPGTSTPAPPAPAATPSIAQEPTAQQRGTQPPNSAQQPGTAPASNLPQQPNAAQDPNAAQAPGTPQEPANDQSSMFVFKREVEEVVLHATVYDEQRHIAPSLDQNAFTVLENGVPQTITSFRREDVPVAIGIIVDNSGSMRDKREKVNQAVLNLIRASNPQDEVFVVNFGENPYLDQDFTSDVNLLQVALHKASTRGATALYDAVVASSAHLSKGGQLGKKVLLVITDGQDNMSQETLQEAARTLQQPNGPTLYAIGLLGSGLQARGREALQRLADGTGGVAYFPETLDQVDSLTRSIGHDIRSQYMIAYRPKNQNGRPSYQSVQVEARAPGYGKLTVRTRTGYYNPESSPAK
jgi:Ca-activated chloride channel homolog